MARGDAPYKIVQKVGDNAYKIKLLGKMSFSTTFNVGNLIPTLDEDEGHHDLMKNPLQGGLMGSK